MRTVKEYDDQGEIYRAVYSRDELRRQWQNERGQGNRQARERGEWCVVLPAGDEETALRLTALFIRQFAIPSCAHWDGETLSCFCGHAGGAGHCRRLMDDVRKLVAPATSEGLFDEMTEAV